MQHPAGQRARVVNLDLMSEAPQVVRCGEPSGPCTHDQDTFP